MPAAKLVNFFLPRTGGSPAWAPYLPGSSGFYANGAQGATPQGYIDRMTGGQNSLIPRSPGATGPFGPTGTYANRAGLGLPPVPSNDFSTVNNIKSPEFQTAIQNALASVGGTAFNPAVNPSVLRTNTKNPALQSAIAGMAGNLDAATNPADFVKSQQFQQAINAGYGQASLDKASNREQFNQFQKLFDSQTPGVSAATGQENDAIGQWYSGGVQNALNANALAQNKAVNLSAERALGTLGRNQSLLRMTHGDSSYATQQALDSAASIYATAANQKAALDRENYLTVLGGQNALLGKRAAGLDYLSNRQMVPINYRAAMGAGEDSRLAGLGQMDLSNNVYTTPAERAQQRASLLSQLVQQDNANNIYSVDNPQNDLTRRVQLLAQLQGLNNANNFYGLQQPRQQDTSGYVPIYNAAGGGRNNFQPSAPSQYQPPRGGGGLTGNQPTADRGYGPNSPYEIYRQNTGVYPDQDPNFSQEAYDYATRQGNAANNGYAQTNSLRTNPNYAPATDSFTQMQNDYARRQALAAAAGSVPGVGYMSPSYF